MRNEQKICMPNTPEDDANKLCTKLGRSVRIGRFQKHGTTKHHKTQKFQPFFFRGEGINETQILTQKHPE